MAAANLTAKARPFIIFCKPKYHGKKSFVAHGGRLPFLSLSFVFTAIGRLSSNRDGAMTSSSRCCPCAFAG
jgi:hypothetical protein